MLALSACTQKIESVLPPTGEIPPETPTVNPAPEIIERSEVFDKLLTPFINEIKRRREKRAGEDSEYSKRIDEELNEGRVNFLLYGYGETHEPPLTEKAIIGSQTIISIERNSQKVDMVSLTHDIRAPEIERYQEAQGQHNGLPIKIDKAYLVGGFDLQKQTLEDATGFSCDFQIAFKEIIIADLVDNIFGGIEVEVPVDFDVYPFYLEGKKFEGRHFSAGKQAMDGVTVIQFIKTVPKTIVDYKKQYYGKSLEHNARKHEVFKSLIAALETDVDSPVFWMRMLQFLSKKRNEGMIEYDFDIKSLLIRNIVPLASMGKFLIRRTNSEQALPKINKAVYIVDIAHGDGGVSWVKADPNPITKLDLAKGLYPDLATEVPNNANPYGDLVSEYWPSVRRRIKELLLGTS